MANETNCPVCGWSYETRPDGCGCLPGNCSMRPLPEFFTDPDRAIAEGYSRELVERHRRPPPPPCPECERLNAALAQEKHGHDAASANAGLFREKWMAAEKERDAALAERDEARAWIRKASEWPISHEKFCAKMRETAPASRCSCGLDTFLAGGEEVKRALKEPRHGNHS